MGGLQEPIRRERPRIEEKLQRLPDDALEGVLLQGHARRGANL